MVDVATRSFWSRCGVDGSRGLQCVGAPRRNANIRTEAETTSIQLSDPRARSEMEDILRAENDAGDSFCDAVYGWSGQRGGTARCCHL